MDYSFDVRAVYDNLKIIVFFHAILTLPIQFLLRRGVRGEVECLRRATSAENQIVDPVNKVMLGGVAVAVEDNEIQIFCKFPDNRMRVLIHGQGIVTHFDKGRLVINDKHMIKGRGTGGKR